jgi:hypothetical protein
MEAKKIKTVLFSCLHLLGLSFMLSGVFTSLESQTPSGGEPDLSIGGPARACG